jgi:hypothetical protein
MDVEIAENDCGAWVYLSGDYNYDCSVDLGDFAIIDGQGEAAAGRPIMVERHTRTMIRTAWMMIGK